MIVLPWPDKRLTANAKRRKHWSVYRPAIISDREVGRATTLAALGCGRRELPDRIPITVRFVPPDRRQRDDDGMICAFKHMRDGIADALGIDDSRFRPTYEVAEPEKPGRVEVTFGWPR